VSGSIMEKIVSAARARGEAMLKEAEAKRSAEMSAGLARLDAEFNSRLAAEKKHVLETDGQEVSAFRLAERNKIRIQTRKLLDGMYEAAWKEALEPARYRRWLEKRIETNCRKGDALVVSAAQVPLFEGDLSDLLKRHGVTVSQEKGSFRAGFIVERGDIRLNCTLDQEMNAIIREKEIEISRILFQKAK
jgi:vacuolar-type H+-ATPase subunit E/Vma4